MVQQQTPHAPKQTPKKINKMKTLWCTLIKKKRRVRNYLVFNAQQMARKLCPNCISQQTTNQNIVLLTKAIEKYLKLTENLLQLHIKG